MIGRAGEGAGAITGEVARAQVHLMRATRDAILVGIGTALSDDPQLTVRLPGLEERSPVRIVLDPSARLPLAHDWSRPRAQVPRLWRLSPEKPIRPAAPRWRPPACACWRPRRSTAGSPCRSCSRTWPRRPVQRPGRGRRRHRARRFLDEGLVDRIVLFEGAERDRRGPASQRRSIATIFPPGFALKRDERFGDDRCLEWTRGSGCSPGSSPISARSLPSAARPRAARLRIETAYDPRTIAIGASIACAGVCLTVTGLPEAGIERALVRGRGLGGGAAADHGRRLAGRARASISSGR